MTFLQELTESLRKHNFNWDALIISTLEPSENKKKNQVCNIFFCLTSFKFSQIDQLI